MRHPVILQKQAPETKAIPGDMPWLQDCLAHLDTTLREEKFNRRDIKYACNQGLEIAKEYLTGLAVSYRCHRHSAHNVLEILPGEDTHLNKYAKLAARLGCKVFFDPYILHAELKGALGAYCPDRNNIFLGIKDIIDHDHLNYVRIHEFRHALHFSRMRKGKFAAEHGYLINYSGKEREVFPSGYFRMYSFDEASNRLSDINQILRNIKSKLNKGHDFRKDLADMNNSFHQGYEMLSYNYVTACSLLKFLDNKQEYKKNLKFYKKGSQIWAHITFRGTYGELLHLHKPLSSSNGILDKNNIKILMNCLNALKLSAKRDLYKLAEFDALRYVLEKQKNSGLISTALSLFDQRHKQQLYSSWRIASEYSGQYHEFLGYNNRITRIAKKYDQLAVFYMLEPFTHTGTRAEQDSGSVNYIHPAMCRGIKTDLNGNFICFTIRKPSLMHLPNLIFAVLRHRQIYPSLVSFS